MFGNLVPHFGQALPRTFLQEPHRRVERRASPHLDREQTVAQSRVGFGDVDQVARAEACCQKRLVRVAKSRIGQEQGLLLQDPLCEFFRAQLLELLPTSLRDRLQGVKSRQRSGGATNGQGVPFDQRVAVDDRVGQKSEQTCRPVPAALQPKELWRVVDKARRAAPGEKLRMRHELHQEGKVRFDAADAELLQAPLHPPGGVDETSSARGHLDQERIVIRRDDCPREGCPGVESDSHAAGRTIVPDAAVVRHEVVRGILGRDAALQGKAGRLHGRLRSQADLGIGKGESLGDEDLRFDDIDAGHLFGDRVLDLDPRIDLDEVELSRFGIDQEFDRSGVLVAEVAADGQGCLTQLVADRRIKEWSRCDLDNLLMASLDRAVALVEMHKVPVKVPQKLDFDVAGPHDESFEKDIGGAEGDLRLALRLFERGGELGGRTDDTHATPASSFGGLDNDGETHLLGRAQPLARVPHGLAASGQNRHADVVGGVAGGYFVSQLLQQFRAAARRK